jgi:hypothetical protein
MRPAQSHILPVSERRVARVLQALKSLRGKSRSQAVSDAISLIELLHRRLCESLAPPATHNVVERRKQRFRKKAKNMQGLPAIERIHAMIRRDKTTTCWEWMGSSNGRYGYVQDDDKRTKLVHRVMYERTHNIKLTSEQHVMHVCDNTWCVNPEHLVLGNARENAMDRQRKGRSYAIGRLTYEQAKAIRLRYAKGEAARSIAPDFGVTTMTVYNISNGYSWRQLDKDPDILAVKPKKGLAERRGKLTPDKVREIRRRVELGEAHKSVAADFGIHTSYVCHITLRRKWANVD